MSDETIEQEIQAKGKTVPRVKPADIEANIADAVYFTAAQVMPMNRTTRRCFPTTR
jgi:hypothetical protein